MGLFGRKKKEESFDYQPSNQSTTIGGSQQVKNMQEPLKNEGAKSLSKWSVQHEYQETIDLEASFTDHLRYSYKDVNIAGASYLDIDYKELKPTRLELAPEPTNEFDNKAIAVKAGGVKLGFVPKGRLQEMVTDYLDADDKYVMAWLVDVDEQEKKLVMSMGFYKREKNEPSMEFHCKLTKTNKKDDFGIKRSENMACSSEGEVLSIIAEMDFETFEESYILMSSIGEIGELPKSAASKLEESGCDIESATAVLEDPDSGVIRLMTY